MAGLVPAIDVLLFVQQKDVDARDTRASEATPFSAHGERGPGGWLLAWAYLNRHLPDLQLIPIRLPARPSRYGSPRVRARAASSPRRRSHRADSARRGRSAASATAQRRCRNVSRP